MDVGPIQNPIAIALSEEDIASLLDPLQDLAVRAASNPLGRQEAGPLCIFPSQSCSRLLEPVAAEVRLAGIRSA